MLRNIAPVLGLATVLGLVAYPAIADEVSPPASRVYSCSATGDCAGGSCSGTRNQVVCCCRATASSPWVCTCGPLDGACQDGPSPKRCNKEAGIGVH